MLQKVAPAATGEQDQVDAAGGVSAVGGLAGYVPTAASGTVGSSTTASPAQMGVASPLQQQVAGAQASTLPSSLHQQQTALKYMIMAGTGEKMLGEYCVWVHRYITSVIMNPELGCRLCCRYRVAHTHTLERSYFISRGGSSARVGSICRLSGVIAISRGRARRECSLLAPLRERAVIPKNHF